MTVWQKLEDENCYAVAIFNFAASCTVPQLPLEVGELVLLERETTSWYWGKSLRTNASGAFPKSYVVVRECTVDRCGDTVVASAGSGGVVHDIVVTLREWMQHWKKLYITRNDELFKFMEVSMRALLELRAQAVSGALPQDQLRRVARTAIFTIDKGNRNLGMELAVRTPSGQLVNPLETSTYKLNAMHEETNTRIDKNMESTPVPAPAAGAGGAGGAATARTYTVAVRVHNFVCRAGDACELLLALHDAAGGKLTDHLLVRWPLPALHTAQVVFTDLGSDIKKEKLFLVCHVVRIGSMDPQNTENKRSSVAQSFPSAGAAGAGGAGGAGGSGPGGIRRPFGVACADVTRHLAAHDPEKHVQLPFYACEKETMDTLLKKVISNRDLKDTKHSQGLWVSLQLVEGDLNEIREKNPHIVVNAAVARKMGFPEVILPGDARNDLYVTLVGGAFSKGGGKSSERNIELTARVVDRSGATLQGVISIGAGMDLVDQYTSLVYYHDDRPRWQEVFKVCLTIEQFKEAHLVFTCRHRSSSEAKDRAQAHFALAYLRLMQREGTTAPDGQHHLCVYKIHNNDTKRGGPEAECRLAAACLRLPARRGELPAGAERGLRDGRLSLVHRDSLLVATRLCSTKLTQKEEILGVLKWHAHHEQRSLRAALARLLHVPSEELVKFLQDILDALFSILTQVEEDTEEYTEDSYGVLVLDGLLRIISIVADHKYQHFQPVLHVYIDKSFCDALAYEKLLAVMVWVIRSAERGEAALKRLLQCMKCLEALVRVVARSRQLRAALHDTADRAADRRFRQLFESLMEALEWLMRCGDPLLTCQGSALKYLPQAVPHALLVYPDTDLSAHVVRALQALSLSRLSKQRMLAALELVRGPLCRAADARSLLLPHLADTVRALLRDKVELDRDAAHKSRSVDKAARLLGADTAKLHDHTHHQQIVELCVETLGEVVTLLARDDVGPVGADRAELARRLLPTVLHAAAAMLRERGDAPGADDALLRRIVSVLLDMVRQMSAEQYAGVVRALEAEGRGAGGGGEQGGGAASLVVDALALMLQLLRRPLYRAHWADMLHLQHHVMLHALGLLSTTLKERLLAAADADEEAARAARATWRRWFEAAAALATSAPLQLEALAPARKRRVAALYGDVRRGVADLLAQMWFGLGEHRRAFIPCLVGPFLEVSFLEDEEVRNTTIPLFFDMMQTEFQHSVISGESEEGHLKELESEIIDKLDVLVSAGRGDGAWRARFVALCGALCEHAPGPLRARAAALVAAAARQLHTLLQYRAAGAAGAGAAGAHSMHLITTVLQFYEEIERPHMYIRYVHRLAEMHQAAGQWAEAGLALRLHATLLDWARAPLPPRLSHPRAQLELQLGRAATQRDLKEKLYTEVAELLKRGRQWELAVDVVKELVSVYEEEALGYGPLAELHQQLARLYTDMLRTPRSHPGYFRVLYHGRGFPDHLRLPNGFVYRGNEYEQLQEFNERLLAEWPGAELLPKLDPPPDHITGSDGQYLQVNAVEPVMGDKLKRLSGRPVAEQILQYYKHNNVAKFVFSRPFHRPDESLGGSSDDLSSQNEFATRWLERTEIEISDKLPGILRWFPVTGQRTYWVSPVEAAVEALREANRTLRALVLEARAHDASLQPLTMRLNGILDPAVQGGIVNYERAFLTPQYEERHPEHAALLAQLKDLIADQIPLLKYGLEVHGARAPAALDALHAHMLACFRRMQHHVHQRYGRRMCDFEPEMPEVQLRMQPRNSTDGEPASTTANRISDISTGNDSAIKSRFFSFNSAINPLTSRNSSSGYFNTLNSTPKRRQKRRPGKSEITFQTSTSQWYTSPQNGTGGVGGSAGAGSAAHTPTPTPTPPNGTPQPEAGASASPLRELRQELVTARPLRAEAERERRLSQLTASAPPSNRDSMGTTDSNQDDEEPPPLPIKSSRSLDLDIADSTRDASPAPAPAPARHSYDTVLSPRGSFLYKSMSAARRNTAWAPCTPCTPGAPGDTPPTPPPKKKNAQTVSLDVSANASDS